MVCDVATPKAAPSGEVRLRRFPPSPIDGPCCVARSLGCLSSMLARFWVILATTTSPPATRTLHWPTIFTQVSDGVAAAIMPTLPEGRPPMHNGRSTTRPTDMNANDSVFNEFRAYWQMSEEMIADATKEDLAEAARILAMQAAHYARKYGEMQLPDLAHLLSTTTVDNDNVGLLRDGTEALVGVLAMVTGVGGVDIDEAVQ